MNKIKEARLATGYSRTEIAKILEIPYRTFEDWENDRSYPKLYFERLILKELKTLKKEIK